MELKPYGDGRLQVRIFQDPLIDERTYLIVTGQEAIAVDPHVDEALLPYLEGVRTLRVYLTHEHYDHICGVNWLRAHRECLVYASVACAESIQKCPNSTVHYPLLFLGDRQKYDFVKKNLKLPYICHADVPLGNAGEQALAAGSWHFWKTEGHSPGGMSFLLDGKYLFSGDSLLGNGMELKSIGADGGHLRRTLASYAQLGGDTLVFPGHGEVNTLRFYFSKAGRYFTWI